MRLAAGLARACHPGPTLTVTAVASAVAATAGRGAGTVWVAAAVFAGQLSVGWSNDYLDRHRDTATARRDKPIVRGDLPARTVGWAAVLALLAAVALSLASGWVAAGFHVIALGAAWSYNLGLKGTWLSFAPYTVAFGALPAFIVTGLPGDPLPPWWLVAAGALLGTGAHFANVLPDLADDLAQGVVGLPHRLGPARSALASATLLGAATLMLAVAPPGGPGLVGTVALVAAGLIALLVPWVARAGTRLPFRFAMTIAVIATAMLVLQGGSVLA